MIEIYLKLILLSLIPVVGSLLIYLLQRYTKFGKMKYMTQQVIIGLLFGGFAVIATEFGVDVNGATANARDAAPLVAGILFGGPSGIIAGLIGGVERFFATYWGRGEYSQIACTVSTILAGLYAALLRKFMFENKRPSWPFAIAIGVVMEVIHLTILLMTHFDDTANCIVILKDVTAPMIFANAFSTMLATILINVISRKNGEENKTNKISDKIQLWLLVLVAVGYAGTTMFTYITQTNSSYINTENLFLQNIEDIKEEVLTFSNDNLLSLTSQIKDGYENASSPLTELRDLANVSEVSIISNDGDFLYSTEQSYVDNHFNMVALGGQAEAFHKEMIKATGEMIVQEFLPQSNSNLLMKYAGIMLSDHSGYIQVGLDEFKFKGTINSKFYSTTSYRHIGKNGYAIILDSDNNIVSDLPYIASTGEKADSSTIGLSVEELNSKSINKRYVADIFNEKTHYMYSVSETYHIIVTMPEYEVFETRDAQFFINSFMQVLLFAAFFLLIYFLVKILVVNNIHIINKNLGSIIKGDLNVKVNVHNTEEFTSLSNDINYTVDALKDLIAQAAARIDKELAFAKSIQLNALPSSWPAYPNEKSFDIFATMNTAKEVGGDFYDLYMIDLDHLAFLIADVSGKGIPAAMFMMESKAMLRNFAKAGMSVDEILNNTNDNLCQGNEAGMFVTCWLGILDKKTGVVEFANAGHNYPAIYRKDGSWELVNQKKNIVLGAFEGIKYQKQTLTLNPGDRIYLYTDGVTEATRGDGALYSDERLVNYLNEHIDLTQKQLLEGIKEDIDVFVEGADQFDDITMLTVDYKGF